MTMWKKPDSCTVSINKRMQDICNVRDYIKQHPKKYKAIFSYACENWNDLSYKARYDVFADNCVSIADQIQMNTDCPYCVAEDVATSISISRALGH